MRHIRNHLVVLSIAVMACSSDNGPSPVGPRADGSDSGTELQPPRKVALTEEMATPYFGDGAAGKAAEAFALERWQVARAGFTTYLASAEGPKDEVDRARTRLLIAIADSHLGAWKEAAAGFDLAARKLPIIADWSGLADFMDVPVHAYSSGMQARLAFAIATDVKPDVLIIDEVLAVGDQAFKKKSMGRIEELMGGGTSVVLVSHSLPSVRRLADRALWLDKGKVKMIDAVDEVVDAYESTA